MVEKGRKGRKIGLFQPSKLPKIREKSRQNSPKPRQNDGKGRQNTGGGHPLRYRGAGWTGDSLSPIRPGAGRRRGAICPASSGGGRGIIGPARPVRGDLSSGAGCCCPLLYSYVGRRGAISYRRGHHRGGGGAWPVQQRRRGAIFPPAAGPGCDPRKSRPRKTPPQKTPHGKGQQKKR